MFQQIHKNVIRILNAEGSTVGAAFLAGDGLILTCAHVVRAAGSALGQKVSLCTPNGTQLTATVESEICRNEEHDDITILRLAKPLVEIRPLPLGASSGSQGHTFSTYGFPKPGQALSGSGTITGNAALNGIQYLQLESSQVTPGFSGAPVFDEVSQRVVGMVAAIAPPDEYQRQGTTAFAIPAETLREVCPELQLSERCPYRSLDAFTEADAELFFGRERVIAKLLESLRRYPRFLAVLGPSGSGKSSVVQAGLIPALKSGHLSSSEKWGILTIRPGTQPFEQLASAGMSDPGAGLFEAASAWLESHPQDERLLILIDQFEELLVSTPSETRADFVAALADLLNSSLPVSVLLTLRDDFYGTFIQEAEPLVGWLERAQVIIPPRLEEGELREIIERPARDLGLRFAPGLVDAILNDARTADPSGRAIRSTVLPLLEFALTQLWERREEGELTHDAYRAMDGVTGGLSQWADRAYYALDEEKHAIARWVFSELVALGDEAQGIAETRLVRNIDELTEKDGDTTKAVLDKLVTARLLVARHDESSGKDTVEIIHETLLREWGLLENWLQSDRQFLLWRDGLRASQQAWQESGQDTGALLRGVPLGEAEEWLEKRGDDLGRFEQEYITKSVALRRRGEHNRRLVMAGLGLVTVVMAVLAFWGSSQATKASRNEADALNQAATAQAAKSEMEHQRGLALKNADELKKLALAENATKLMDEYNPGTALTLSMHATEGETPPEKAQTTLQEAAYLWLVKETYFPCSKVETSNQITQNPWVVALSIEPRQGEIIAAGCTWKDESKVIFMDVNTGNIFRVLPYPSPIITLAFHPENSDLLAGYADGAVILWRKNSEEPEFVDKHLESISAVAFTTDGKKMMVASYDETISLFETSSGKILKKLQNSTSITHFHGKITTATFSPDGGKIAYGDEEGYIGIWDINFDSIYGPKLAHEGFVLSVTFSPDGSELASGSADYTVMVWKWKTNTGIISSNSTRLKPQIGWINQVVYSADGNKLLLASANGKITLWDVPTWQLIQRMDGHQDEVDVVLITPDSHLAISGARDGSIRIWDINILRAIAVLSEQQTAQFYEVTDVVIPKNNNSLYTSTSSGQIILWDLSSNSIEGRWHFSAIDIPIYGLDSSDDSERLLVGAADGQLFVLDVATKEILKSLKPEINGLRDVDISPDGTLALASYSNGMILLWDMQTWEQKCTFMPSQDNADIGHSSIVNSARISADNTYIVSGSNDHSVIVWEVTNCQDADTAERYFGHDSWVMDVDISPDGQLLASASADQTIIIWDRKTKRQLHRLQLSGVADSGLDVFVQSLDFSGDGRLLASGHANGNVAIWSIDNGRLLRRFFIDPNPSCLQGIRCFWTWGVKFSPDGNTLYSTHADGALRAWSLVPFDNLYTLRSWVETNRTLQPLTAEEQEIYDIQLP
jgi:WD40 repeat protein